MVSDRVLADTLTEFALTMIVEAPVPVILDGLVARIASVVPITSAGATVVATAESAELVAASDADALRYERLQSEFDEGPCRDARASGREVRVPDLAVEERFRRFTPAARRAGLAAVFAFPLRHGDARLGALDLYRTAPGPLDASDAAAAQQLADVATACLVNARERDTAHRASERFHYAALHDPLTGLANRPLLLERLAHASRRAGRSHSHTAALFIDIDRFKDVNDAHGHDVGDQLLIEIAHRLSAVVRAGDTLARISGDEFVLLSEDLSHPDDVEALGERVRSLFDEPFHLDANHITVSASVGLACAGPEAGDVGRLLVASDLAMYAEKRARTVSGRLDG